MALAAAGLHCCALWHASSSLQLAAVGVTALQMLAPATSGWLCCHARPPARPPCCSIRVCRTAVQEFFQRNMLKYTIHEIDGSGAYFQKLDAAPIDAAWYTHWNGTRSTADAQSADEASRRL